MLHTVHTCTLTWQNMRSTSESCPLNAWIRRPQSSGLLCWATGSRETLWWDVGDPKHMSLFVFIMSRLVHQTFVLDGWCCVVPYLLVLSKLFFAWTHQVIWKGAVLGSLYKSIVSPDNKTVADSSSLQHLCSMKVWEGIIPSWYVCFRQLDWRNRLQMSCQLQWCWKMITSLSNPQTFPCRYALLSSRSGQLEVSRRIADILYGVGNLDIKPQLNSFARIPVNMVPCKHLLHGNYRWFEIFLWRLMRISSTFIIHPGFLSEKVRQNGHSIQDLSFGLGLLSQPGVDGVGVLDVVMWWFLSCFEGLTWQSSPSWTQILTGDGESTVALAGADGMSCSSPFLLADKIYSFCRCIQYDKIHHSDTYILLFFKHQSSAFRVFLTWLYWIVLCVTIVVCCCFQGNKLPEARHGGRGIEAQNPWNHGGIPTAMDLICTTAWNWPKNWAKYLTQVLKVDDFC